MQVIVPQHANYLIHDYTWPWVYQLAHARVVTFKARSSVTLAQLAEDEAMGELGAELLLRCEAWPAPASGSHDDDAEEKGRSYRDFEDFEDDLEERAYRRVRERRLRDDGSELSSLALVWDLPGGVRAWAEQGGSGSTIVLTVAGEAEADLDGVRAWFEKRLPPRTPPAGKVTIAFTYEVNGDAQGYDREIAAPHWAEIRGNYPRAVQPELDRLMALRPDGLPGGKIGILHGPPGTGKTHLIRALAREWRDWANIRYVLDTEKFFGEPSYMLDVILGNAGGRHWNVILCEDAEEYLAPDSKRKVGQALSRLLNAGDGLIGQGLQLLFLFTTNAPEPTLHEAITRAGRCFVKLRVPLLPREEARAWLGDGHAGEALPPEISLGDLYEIKNKQQIAAEVASPRAGAYL